jgi:L-rhamnose-H+ transport protein
MNPFLGVVFHWLGGLASGSFYVPYRGVRRWAWETYWLVGGFFSWIIAPWILGYLLTNNLLAVLHDTPSSAAFMCYFWGAMWGLCGLTFGLTMRYLGMSLGMAIALGYCAAFGTLMPPLFAGTLGATMGTVSGQVIMAGVVVCLGGIAVCGLAGVTKEREMSDEQKKAAIKEFNFWKGILVATFSGIMSASFAYGLSAGSPIAESALKHGADTIWTGLPKLVVVLAGGFTSNFIWCLILLLKNGTLHQYVSPVTRQAEGNEPAGQRVPMLANYLFSALAGVTWYMQFFFYTMGETQMGDYQFSSWTIHMASIIIFSSLWGIALKEWRGSSRYTKCMLGLALATLVGSTVVIGYGTKIGSDVKVEAPAADAASKTEAPAK